MLELAKQLGNVSQACKITGYSQDTSYRYQELYQNGGEVALYEISRKTPIPKNREPEQVEWAVVHMAVQYPACGVTKCWRRYHTYDQHAGTAA